MKKHNVTVKKSLSLTDKIQYSQFLAESCFREKEDGTTEYTPFFREVGEITAFFSCCVTGLELESTKDTDGNTRTESLYAAVTADEELMELYRLVLDSPKNGPYRTLLSQLWQAKGTARELVEFRKQKLIHEKKDSLSALLDTFTEKLNAFQPEML